MPLPTLQTAAGFTQHPQAQELLDRRRARRYTCRQSAITHQGYVRIAKCGKYQREDMSSVASLRLCDIASKQVLTVTPNTPMDEAIACLARHQASSLVVIDQGKPVGIVTERDLLRLMLVGTIEGQQVRAVMSAPLLTARLDLDYTAAQLLMAKHGIRHLILVDDEGKLVGLASETDFRRHVGSDLLETIQNLGPLMDQSVKLLDPGLSLAEALLAMSSARLDHVLVGRGGRAEGILTERDIPRLLACHADPLTLTLGEAMSVPLSSSDIEASAAQAARRMDESGLRHLVVVGSDGRLLGVVSEHRMLEKLGVVLLTESRAKVEERLNMLLEATGVGTWEYNHEHGSLTRSPALNGMLQRVDEVSVESLDDFLSQMAAEDRQRLAASFRADGKSDTGWFTEDFRLSDSAGRVRWMSSRGRVVERDNVGRPLRSLGVLIDIGDQEAFEQNLCASEARFRGLLENLPLPLGQVNARQELVFINHHFTELFGYTLDEIPNVATWASKAYPDENTRARMAENWDRAVLEATTTGCPIRPAEYQVRCKDGALRIVEISGIAFGGEMLTTFIDVTERRQQQAQLDELRRWQRVTLDREGRVLELKREVNALLGRLGEAPRYGSVSTGGEPA